MLPATVLTDVRAGNHVRLLAAWRGALVLLLLLAAPSQAETPAGIEPLAHFPQADLTIVAGGHQRRFRVWIADTPARRAQGLMFVKQLGADRGMLFLFDPAQYTSFWMKNTYIPLDLLFVAPNGRITNVVERAVPFSTDPLPSAGPVTGVVELAGGTASRLGIKAGDQVVYPAFNALRTG